MSQPQSVGGEDAPVRVGSEAVDHDLVLVVDFGAQYAQLIARRVREANVYSEVMPHTVTAAEIAARKPKAVILSGGPQSVYAPGAPQVDPALFETGVATFGICYGFQAMARALGGDVARTGISEFGRTSAHIGTPGTLLADLPSPLRVWMSHGDSVAAAPAGFTALASSEGAPIAAFEDAGRGFAGVQWHPEVLHTQAGQKVLEQFLFDIAGCRPDWTAANIVDDAVAAVREQVGDKQVICGLSGGVDSAVAAALVQRAVGDQLTCVFVDHGLLREGEAEQVKRDFVAATGVDLVVVDAADQFVGALAGVTDPETKRKIIGREFIRTFEAAARDITRSAEDDVEFLVQGTLYPDVVESGGGEGAANIKSHHNVGGLPDDLQFALVEPLRTLFKDEVRAVGAAAGAAGRDRLAAPVPRSRAGHPDHRRGDPRAADDPAAGRRHRPRRADGGRARPRRLAVPRRAAGRRALRRRPGRRPDLRPPRRAAAGEQRGRHDGGLEPAAVRGAGEDQHPHHQRGARGQPRRARHHQQAAGDHRVGVTARGSDGRVGVTGRRRPC